MSFSAISLRRLHRLRGLLVWMALLGVAASGIAGAALAEENDKLEARGEATLGTSLYFIDGPYDNDFLGGFWDQYRQTRKKNDDPAYFIDLIHFDLGLARDDDTYVARIEGWSPNRNNDRVELEGDFEGLGLDLEYHNFRSEELRYYPHGTFQDVNPPGVFPYATQYTPDADLSEIRNRNRRLWITRRGVNGEIRLRPEGFGFALPVIDQVSLRSGYESRKGYRQDSFLLDPDELTAPNQRFRGNRRRVDQEVTNVGGGFVLTPTEGIVTDLDLSFESFREKADPTTFADIHAADSDLSLPILGNSGLRGFNFVPNTDRVSASMRVDARIGPVRVQGGSFVTHLRQTNKAPLQRALGLDKQEVTTWSAHGGFDADITRELALNGFAKFAERRNGLDENDFEAGRTIGPILRRKSELDMQLELSYRPVAGALLASGYRYNWIDRSLRYPIGAIDPPIALVEGDSEAHTLYVRGRTRLLRSGQISGELGWEYRPERDYPSDMTRTLYFDGRGAYTVPGQIPITLSVHGGVRDGHGNGQVLTGQGTQARKDLDRLQWSYGATLTAVPHSRTTLTVSFVQHHDEQDTPYLRTDVPRTFGSAVTDFVLDPDRVRYDSDVRTVAFGATHQLSEAIDLRGFANLNFVEADIEGDNPTGSALDRANEIRNRILSTGGGIGFRPVEGLRFDVGYRFDEYVDRRDHEPIEQDDRRHSIHFGITASLGLFTGSISR